MSSRDEREPEVHPRSSDVEYTSPLDSSDEESYNMEDLRGETSSMSTINATATSPEAVLQQALTPKAAVSYLRVSTRDQATRGGEAEGFSIPAQREANRKKAASLGAIVIKEFVDRGASAKSANRPELKRMLDYVADHAVDYVIVHKLDRLARNRADDVDINRELDIAGVKLVSTTESIDQTPSGMLLHGIMSSIAEFYSRNLANEVLKGMTEKARTGGTPTKAPIGYRNVRHIDAEGREVRDVELDAERAPLMKQAFAMLATGDWNVRELTEHLAGLGLTTAPTPHMPSRPVTDSLMYSALANPYYTGVVSFQGVTYPGKHEALVDQETWDKAQAVVSSHVNGERTRRHPHFLRSTVYCGSCEQRLIVTNAKSRSGDRYPYFICSGRHSKRNNCQQKAVLIYEVEQRIEQHYATLQLSPDLRAKVESALREEIATSQTTAASERRALQERQAKLERERDKLMEAHYAGAVPLDLLKREQDRIATGLHDTAKKLGAGTEHHQRIETNLRLALDLAESCGTAYATAPDHIKKLFNQAFFFRILVNPDASVRPELAPPFNHLLGPGAVTTFRQTKRPVPKNGPIASGSQVEEASKGIPLVHGLSTRVLVGPTGLEPMTPAV